MFISALEQRATMLVADQSMVAALRAILSYQPGLNIADLAVCLESHTISINGTVPTERDRQKLLDVVHGFTAIPISCLVSVKSVSPCSECAGSAVN